MPRKPHDGAARTGLVHAGSAQELRRAGLKLVQIGHTPVLVLHHEGAFHALDNRCPHMGFPLHRGDVANGLLDCHWHHARFDITCGATLDPWADDVDAYRVVVEDGEVYVDPTPPPRDARAHGLARLRRGLEERLTLVTAKAVLEHADARVDPREAIALAARYGASERARGWSVGLSILSALANVLEDVAADDRPRALVHGATRVAADASGEPPRRPLPPLVGSRRDAAGLRAWLRETVEVRDADGAERVLATIAERHGATAALDAVLAAATDHRYSDGGHTLDYAVKCAELAERLDEPELTALLFTSLVPQLVGMQRMEETSAWRRPIDVAELVAGGEKRLADLWDRRSERALEEEREEGLVRVMLGERPDQAIGALLEALAEGVAPAALADAVVSAAGMRLVHFSSANELADWDTVHHTLTYVNAVAEGMRRAPSAELFRGVLDGAMSVYLDRFLNVPPAKLPEELPRPEGSPAELAAELLRSYDGRSPVERATALAHGFLAAGGAPAELFATLAHAVLREDSGFHDYQELELAHRRLSRRGDHPSAGRALVGCARWLAAHYPTPRAAEQTFTVARRLMRGEPIFE